MKKYLAMILAAVCLFACISTTAFADDPIVIGILQDTTGGTATLGKSVQKGVEDAIADINAAGGIGGKEVKFIEYDTAANVDTAIAAYIKAVTVDEVDFIIAPPIANIVNGLKAMTATFDVPMITLAVDPACYKDENGNIYSTLFCAQPSTTVQGTIMAEFALQNNFKNFGVFYTKDNSYSVALLNPFIDTVRANGGVLEDANIIGYNSTETDISTLIKPLIDAGVDAIYCPNYTAPLVLIKKTCDQLGYTGAIITGLDGAPAFNTQVGADCSNVYYINNIDIYDPTVAEMASKVSVGAINKYFLGYDAVMLAKKCIEEAGLDADALAEAIVNVKGFEGLTGTFNMDPNTHMPAEDTPMFMYTYDVKTPVMLKEFSFK